VHSRTTHERTHASPLCLFLYCTRSRRRRRLLFPRPTPAMPGAAVCRHSSALLSSIDSPLAPPLYAFAARPRQTLARGLAWTPPAATGSGATGCSPWSTRPPLRLCRPRRHLVLSRPPPEPPLDLAVLGSLRHRRGRDLVRLDELCILPQLDLVSTASLIRPRP
jgi:hypothetical protein